MTLIIPWDVMSDSGQARFVADVLQRSKNGLSQKCRKNGLVFPAAGVLLAGVNVIQISGTILFGSLRRRH
jgi:hypothetical protein